MMSLAFESLLEEAKIPSEALTDRAVYIRTVRAGISGAAVKAGTKLINRQLFIRLFETNSANLSRLYSKKKLNRNHSEEFLDIFSVTGDAIRIWGDQDLALQW
ncbi:MAG: hypothetical protein MJK13_11705, partial [Pseudomonadales bacterium]|nr:hypothetical protein [Pseudomonadales bacterium]